MTQEAPSDSLPQGAWRIDQEGKLEADPLLFQRDATIDPGIRKAAVL